MICCLNPYCEQPINRDRQRHCQCCGKPLKKLLDNRYKIARPLARGSFGKIYLAQDTRKFEELCVVKQLAFGEKGKKIPEKVKQLFEKEAIQLKRLGTHPQIPTLLAYFEEDHSLYLAQQLIEGQNLLEKLKQQGRFNEKKIREFLLEILPVLEFIHESGVVHRDIKLSNIMWTYKEGKYVLIDFGLSKMFNLSMMKTRGTILGSYGYSAPEQILNGKVSPASDLFSLGATCFYLLTGISPSRLWEKQGYEWTQNWQQWLKTPISPQLTFVLDKLLQKDITQRYQKAATVLSDCQQSPISETRVLRQIKYALKSLRERRGWLKLVAMIVLGVSIAVVAGHLLEGKQAVPPQNSPQFMAVDNVPYGVFHYGGSTTWAPIRRDVDPVIQSVWSEFKLHYVQHPVRDPGSDTGIWMLLHNQIAFAQSSRPLTPEEKRLAHKNGFTLEQIAIAIDGIAIAVHPELKLPGLTVAQLRDIYTGKITNWQEVGGPNREIIPYSRPLQTGGTVGFFRQQVLQREKFADQVKFIANTTLGIRAVARNLGGIYYASAAEVVEQCTVKTIPIGYSSDKLIAPYIEPAIEPKLCPQRRNQINRTAFQQSDYPLIQKLFVIIKVNAQIEEQAGRAYANLLLSDRGQQLIDKAGYIPIR